MHSHSTPFVGRQQELEAFHHLLTDDTGRAIVIVGQQGMGKTTLANELVSQAQAHFNECFCLRYNIIQQDTADAIMERMLEEAFAGAKVEGSFSRSPKSRSQWAALLKVLPKGKDLLGLFQALKQQPGRPVRERLLVALQQVSTKLKAHQRLVFVIDPDEYMQQGSAGAWAALVRELPERILLIFPQRPGDELAQHGKFFQLENVVRLPKDELEHLEAEAVEVLVDRTEGLPFGREETLAALRRYNGHPYAVAAGLDLLVKGQGTPSELPSDPAGIAAKQWQRVCQTSDEWIRAFKAYALLEVAVPAEVACAVAEITPETLQRLRADAFVGNLLDGEPSGSRIYHSLLSDHIAGELSAAETKRYHERARDAWRQRLEESEPKEALAAQRLPEHVLVVEGEAAFAEVVALTSAPALRQLGLLQEDLAMLQRAQNSAEPGSTAAWSVPNELGIAELTLGNLSQAETHFREVLELAVEEGLEAQAAAFGNLGLIYKTRGDLDEAEKMHHKALEIHQQLGSREGMASDYGNLGLIYKTRGDLDEAEKMHHEALEIDQQLGSREGMASAFGNLGLIYLTRGDLDGAEKMHHKALEIHQQLGSREGMASDCGNLGLIYLTRGDLDEAEKMVRKALEINQQLGSREGMASDYGNLGLIYLTRGDLDEAEKMVRKALEINQQLGSREGIASQYGNLAEIFEARGQLGEAEKFVWASLEISEPMGHLEYNGDQYLTLGRIFRARGNTDSARSYWQKAYSFFEQLGSRLSIEKAKSLLASLDD